MKKLITTYITIASILFLISACKELDQPVVLNPSQLALLDTSYVSTTAIAAAPKNVMMEEFSGVKCPNCPTGNAKSKEIHLENPSRVTIVTVHSNSLASPFSGDQDLRSDDADELVNVLGPLGAKPSTFINRSKLQDPNKTVIAGDPTSMTLWKTYVDAELAKTVPVKLSLETIYVDVEKRKFRYKIVLEFAEAMQNINLGFLLTESEIETQQLDGVTHLEEYTHEFVLRDFISSILGEALTENIVANTVIIKEFEIDLNDFEARSDGKYTNPADWKIDNMELIAFIRAENDELVQSIAVEL